MGLPKNLLRENIDLNEWAILRFYRGSIAHGMYIPKSDPIHSDLPSKPDFEAINNLCVKVTKIALYS